MRTSPRWAAVNSPKIPVKSVHPAGGQSRPPLQRVRRVVVGADDSVGPLRSYKFAVDSRKNGAFCRADVGIGLYGHAGKCIRIRRRFSIIRCILPGGAEPRPYQLRLHFNGFCVKQTVYGLKLMTLPGGEALGAPAPVLYRKEKFLMLKRTTEAMKHRHCV